MALREHEAEIAVALRQRDDGTPSRDRYLESGDSLSRARLLHAGNVLEDPLLRYRQHHHAGGHVLAAHVVEREAESVPQDQLLERHAEAEPEAARAEPADRARGELEHPRRRAEAQLRVDRAFGEAERPRRVAGQAMDLFDDLWRLARRSDVDRLLEVGAVERVWLVEDREHLEPAVLEQPFDRHLVALGEALHEELGALVAEDRADALRCAGGLLGRVRTNHALAAGARERLEDAREADRFRVVAGGPFRLRDAGRGEGRAHLRLVARSGHRLGRAAAQAEALRRQRRRTRAAVA